MPRELRLPFRHTVPFFNSLTFRNPVCFMPETFKYSVYYLIFAKKGLIRILQENFYYQLNTN